MTHCATPIHQNNSRDDSLLDEYLDPRLLQGYEEAPTFVKTKLLHEYSHRVEHDLQAPLENEKEIQQMKVIAQDIAEHAMQALQE